MPPLLVLLATGLVLLGASSDVGVFLALPLAAVGTAVVVAIGRPGRGWRWAAFGTALWSGEEALWSANRLLDLGAVTVPITDGLYLAGAASWLLALHRMPGRMWPGRTLLAALPPAVLLLWLLLQDPDRSLWLQFPLVDLALIAYATPLLESTFRGRASEARVLWALGLFVRALAAGIFVWLGPSALEPRPFLLLWLLGYTFIALGVWLERRTTPSDLWVTAYAVLGLEAAVGLVLALIYRSQVDARGPLVLVALLLGYCLFAGVLVIIAGDRRQRRRAEADLAAWTALLERLVTAPPAVDDPPRSLERLLTTLGERFPDLTGIETYGPQSLCLGEVGGYAFPIVSDGSEIGHLYFRRQPPPGRALDALAPLVAGHIRQLRSYVRWQNQAVTDPLTGLFNRRGLELRSAALFGRARRNGTPLSVVVLDLDHFKRVNDVYGHAVGDEVLRSLAQVLEAGTRSDDLVVRWGGEEFVLVLADTDAAAARQTAQRIRDDLNRQRITPIAWPLTLSAGVASGVVLGKESPLHDLITRADRALMAAKAAGRDRIEVVPPP